VEGVKCEGVKGEVEECEGVGCNCEGVHYITRAFHMEFKRENETQHRIPK